MPTRILLWSPFDDYLVDVLSALPGVSMGRVASAEELAASLPEADALVMVGHFYTAPVAALIREKGQRLRWIQLTTAGFDGFAFHGVPAHIAVTNAGHSHAPAVAEHAVMLLTALVRRLPGFADAQRRRVFDLRLPAPLTTLEDATVTILGYGGIGREIARRVRPFQSRIIAVARSARDDDIAERVVAADALRDALCESDALVIAAALTAETRGMVDAAALAALKPGAILVNIARGAIVDTMALVDALHNGHLSGAGLDVTDPEPPPADHPLWSCPNLIVTPHVSGMGSPGVYRRIADVVRSNAMLFLSGESLRHRVM